jgi:electron transfer flavoprotein beta subunit
MHVPGSVLFAISLLWKRRYKILLERQYFMEILVCIKQVPETNQVEVDPVTGVLKRNGVLSKMNPYDLYALETALQLRQMYGGSVSVISMGPPQAQQTIREAYAMGADRGFLLTDRRFGGADVLATSYTLSQGIKKAGQFDVILCGKQTTDGDTAQVGPEIAEYLDIPSLANVISILSVEEDAIVVKADMGGDVEEARVLFPCLLSVEKDIYQPRLPSFVRKMDTKDRPVTLLGLNDMDDRDETHYGLTGSPTQVQRIFPPESHVHQEMWHGSGQELADKLFDMLGRQKILPQRKGGA